HSRAARRTFGHNTTFASVTQKTARLITSSVVISIRFHKGVTSVRYSRIHRVAELSICRPTSAMALNEAIRNVRKKEYGTNEIGRNRQYRREASAFFSICSGFFRTFRYLLLP